MNNIFNDIFGCTNCTNLNSCMHLMFALKCMFFGFLCVILDYMIYKTAKTNYLSIKYEFNILGIIIFWTLGASIVGYIGSITEIFNTTKILSALFVAVSWQLIFSKWASNKFFSEESQPQI
jgi:uncharacterized membrane protein